MRRVQRRLGRVPNGDRQMVDILGAVLTDGLDAVETACAEALGEGVHSAAVILNILARHREPAPPLTIATPEALRLTCEPAADCARYDSLRRPDHGTIAGAGRNGPAEALRHEGGLRRDHGHGREAERLCENSLFAGASWVLAWSSRSACRGLRAGFPTAP
jgi:hypothetical protein